MITKAKITKHIKIVLKVSIYCLTTVFATSSHVFCSKPVNYSLNFEQQKKIQTKITWIPLKTFRKSECIKRVVIDAGHGGNDSGCSGKLSVEKDIALAIALKTGQTLKQQSPSLEVIYTRKTDVFIPLHERIGLANERKADLFVSVHCNYVDNPHVCGTETFVMGLHRAEENLTVAKRENESVLLESEYDKNYDGYDPNSPVGHILLSMIQNVFLDHSILLAANIEENFTSRRRTESRGVKQAGFVVLREATMPSVLIESGFLSNPKEEKYLMSGVGQQEIAEGIASGILAYFNSEYIKSEPTNSISEVKTSFNRVIQLGVFRTKKTDKYLHQYKNYGKVSMQKTNSGLYRYFVTGFDSETELQQTLQDMRSVGLKDIFISTED